MFSIRFNGCPGFLMPVLVAAVVMLQTTGAPAVEPNAGRSDVGYGFSYTPLYQFAADMDSGGEFDVQRHFLRWDISKSFDRRWTIGIGLSFDYERWHFSNVPGLSGVEPWKEIFRPGVSIPIFYRTDSNWVFGFVPAFDAGGADGAEFSESLSYGAVLSAAHAFGPDLMLGLGAGIFERLDQTEFFPYVVIDWKINDRLRLTNPLRAGPVGPAGLELVYSAAERIEVGVGGAYRSYRFRLDDSGTVADGIGEVDFYAAFVRVGWQLGKRLQFDVNGGLQFEGKITIEDRDGDELGDVDYDPAPFVGITFRGRF